MLRCWRKFDQFPFLDAFLFDLFGGLRRSRLFFDHWGFFVA